MAKLRSISTSIWSDPFIEELTPQEKLLFIYLITNEKTNMLGIYELSERKISFETGIQKETLSNLLERFETLKKIKRVGNFLVICNFLKHQNYNTNMKKSAIDIYNILPEILKIQGVTISRDKPSEAFESLCKGFGTVRKREVELEAEEEREDEVEDEAFIDDKNSLITIERCKEKYLSNEKIKQAVSKNPENKIKYSEIEGRIELFNGHLVETGDLVKSFNDYCKHFRDWHKKNRKANVKSTQRQFL